MFICRAVALYVMAVLVGASQSTSCAAEQWPDQPIGLPYLGPPPPNWPHDPLLGYLTTYRKRVGIGGIFSIPVFGGVFFGTKADLETFKNHSRQMGQSAHALHSGEPLLALENISASSAGGRVWSPTYGQGFAIWSTSTGDYLVQSMPSFNQRNRFHRFTKARRHSPADAAKARVRGTTPPH